MSEVNVCKWHEHIASTHFSSKIGHAKIKRRRSVSTRPVPDPRTTKGRRFLIGYCFQHVKNDFSWTIWSRSGGLEKKQSLVKWSHNFFVIMNQTDLLTSQKLHSYYNTLIKPIFDYGTEMLGYYKAPEVEYIISKFCRKLLRVKRSTNLNAMYGELGCLSMNIRRKLSMTKYWLKIIHSPEKSLQFKTY